jgi:hypothetical protein
MAGLNYETQNEFYSNLIYMILFANYSFFFLAAHFIANKLTLVEQNV